MRTDGRADGRANGRAGDGRAEKCIVERTSQRLKWTFLEPIGSAFHTFHDVEYIRHLIFDKILSGMHAFAHAALHY